MIVCLFGEIHFGHELTLTGIGVCRIIFFNFFPIFCFYSQFGCTEVKLKLPSELWSSGALPRWFKYGSEFSFSNPPPRFSNPKKSSRKRFIFHSFTNFTLNRKHLLTTLYVTLQLKCLSILYSSTCSALQKQNEEASSEYCEKFHEISLAALVAALSML